MPVPYYNILILVNNFLDALQVVPLYVVGFLQHEVATYQLIFGPSLGSFNVYVQRFMLPAVKEEGITVKPEYLRYLSIYFFIYVRQTPLILL